MILRVLAIFPMLLAAISTARAEPMPQGEVVRKLPPRTVQMIAQNPDRYIENTIRQLYQLAPDGVLTEEVLEKRKRLEAAQNRSRRFSQSLRYDLNGDLKISNEEFEELGGLFSGSELGQLEIFRRTLDTNRDGDVSSDEMMADARDDTDRQAERFHQRYGYLMLFDLNDDGKVTAEEIVRGTEVLDDDRETLTP
ncbi:EF hand [Methyloligella halotolerans]|uniref:EF hand n=2 Tax=Methyloligella halotolerans TaxID=1177755 RepID=A0A1E2S184_9HYPH|nr:EF hand [Methyloligella halotolerans]